MLPSGILDNDDRHHDDTERSLSSLLLSYTCQLPRTHDLHGTLLDYVAIYLPVRALN